MTKDLYWPLTKLMTRYEVRIWAKWPEYAVENLCSKEQVEQNFVRLHLVVFLRASATSLREYRGALYGALWVL